MPNATQDCSPHLAIGQALALTDATACQELGFLDEQLHTLPHRLPQRLVVQKRDLQRMAAMGLGHLPIDAIAISDQSPLLRPERMALQQECHFERKLSQYFPAFFVAMLYELQSVLNRTNNRAYLIGGIVRKVLLSQGRLIHLDDVDLTVEGDALRVAANLVEASRNFSVVHSYPEFGTVKLKYKNQLAIDLASTRTERYAITGALPEVLQRGVPLVEDLYRRDFTVNALAMSLHELGHVQDYTCGMADIDQKILRVLHPASFFEDPSRIIRALRFSASLGFTLSGGTQRLLRQFLNYSPLITAYRGGGDRIKAALKQLYRLPDSTVDHAPKCQAIALFLQHGMWRLIHAQLPEALSTEHQAQVLRAQQGMASLLQAMAYVPDFSPPPDLNWSMALCWLFELLEPTLLDDVMLRLCLNRTEKEGVRQYRHWLAALKTGQYHWIDENASPAQVYDCFHSLPLATASALCLRSPNPTLMIGSFQRYLKKWAQLKAELTGDDLLAMGVPQGSAVGLMLRKILRAKLDGHCKTREDEWRFVELQLERPETLLPLEGLGFGL